MGRDNHKTRGEHFSEQRWSDFVRGLADEAVRQEMQAHLDSGCAACRKVAVTLGLVAQLGQSDAGLHIPPDAILRARGLFERSPTTWMESLTPLVAELVASFHGGWQPAGVRSLSPALSGERMVFRAGEYAVDLTLEPPVADQTGEIIGQIANQKDRDEILDGILVQMVSAGRVLGETSTNRFGEFLMDYPLYKSAILHLALKHRGHRIDLSLDLSENP